MTSAKFSRYFHTVRHLRAEQIGWRVFYRLRRKWWQVAGFPGRDFQKKFGQEKGRPPVFSPGLAASESFLGGARFRFLNVEHDFGGQIDWDFRGLGHLWAYNLNYFDWLAQPGLSVEVGLAQIADFIQNTRTSSVGFEPYPTSVRLISWAKFLATHGIERPDIRAEIRGQAEFLSQNLEFHLLGNHLLENGFGLFFAAVLLRDGRLLRRAERVLSKELDEQFTRAGAHFEQSPMYHALLLHRLLDSVNLARSNPDFPTKIGEKLAEKSASALGWLESMTFSDGSFPMVNDSAPGIAPTAEELKTYAKSLGIEPVLVELERFEPGYRMLREETFDLFIDAAPIGPDYQPGHAHSDTLNFLLHVKGRPVLVDPGISTYEKNDRRQLERSTRMHNTVSCEGEEQSDVWGGFRVGRRARVGIWEDKKGEIGAAIFTFERLDVLYSRKWEVGPHQILLKELADNPKGRPLEAHWHFHPNVRPKLDGNRVEHELLCIEFAPEVSLSMEKYLFAEGWNRLVEADVVVARFVQTNHVLIKIL